MRALLLCAGALAAGCGGDDLSRSVADPTDYTGPDGIYLIYGHAQDPAGGSALLLRAEASTWTLREGREWPTAEEVAALEIRTDDGLRAGDTLLLPESLIEGESSEGATVVGFQETEVYYGTFVDTVVVDIADGDWAGAQVFALDIGLVALTWRGEARELIYYE
jgi:hypothetical protein